MKVDLSESFALRDGDRLVPSFTLMGAAKACGQDFDGKLVTAEEYMKNEALIAFISGETGLPEVRSLATAIHDNLARAGGELGGVRELLYGGSGRGPIDSITRVLQSEIALLTASKKKRDDLPEDVSDLNGGSVSGGNGAGRSEKLKSGDAGTGTVVALFSGGCKVTVPGGGKAVAVA